VTGRHKRAIEDHFDKSIELETSLQEKGKSALLELVESIGNMADIHYIRQKEPKGLGHAIYCARKFIGDEAFAVLLGDDIVKGDPPCLKQLLDVYEQTGHTVLGVQKVPEDELYKYGVVASAGHWRDVPGTWNVVDLVEKPKVEPPSNLAIMGRYVIRPEIFDILEQTEPGAGGEIQLTDALRRLAQLQRMVAYEFTGKRYDVGDKLGYLQATVEFALDRPDLHGPFMDYLHELMMKFDMVHETN